MEAPSARALLIGILGLWLLTDPVLRAAGQTPATARLTGDAIEVRVNDPRPLARVLDELEPLCGCAITYEDVRYLKGDLVEVPRGRNGEGRIWIPKGGPFEFSYDGIITLVHQRVPGVLSSLLHRYNRTRYPGRYALAITGPVFHVLPADSEERHASKPGVSLLDTPIQFDSKEGTMAEAADAVTRALTATTGENVQVAFPVNLFENRRLVIEADQEPARDVLLRILATSGRPLSWRLLYDAATESYALNFHIVRHQ